MTPRKADGEKNKWRQEADAEPCLFGWQGITEYDRSVVITEGEIDALSLARLGVKALSIPAGANNTQWLEYDYPNFHLSMKCYICTVVSGKLELLEHEAAKWLDKYSLDSVAWLPADLGLVDKLKDYLSKNRS